MAEIINLRQVRKTKRRVADGHVADANRARFGRTKGEKLAQDAVAERRERLLDGARRDRDD